MTNQLFVRVAGALGVTALAVFFLSLIPFFDLTAGAGVSHTFPVSVDRTLKGDRLPLASEINSAVSRNEPKNDILKERATTPQEIPFACDASFSPISAPHLALVYGRCLS
ncbi:MAG TPA: hypothetical protein VH206_12045 [Xanthobacteraceae bacterium]|jgi:hypothetical protein|nr:hypothetical protein [Xanthobacteraceae bacterium]